MIILYKHASKKTCGSYFLSSWKTGPATAVMLWSSSVFCKDESSSELNLIFIYFSSWLPVLLVFDLIRPFILLYSSSYFLNMPLLSSVGTSVKDLFPLLSLMYPFILLPLRYNVFTQLILTCFEFFILTYPMKQHGMTFHLFWFYLDKNFLYWSCHQKK